MKIFVCIFANIRKKPYLCTIKITNNRAAQLVKHCTETMTITSITSEEKAVRFLDNGSEIYVAAMMRSHEDYGDGWEYWFTIGTYSTMKAAKRYAAAKMEKRGYKFAF